MAALGSLLFTSLVKGTLILAVALTLSTALRRAPGVARHRLWSLAFAGLLLLPALITTLPRLPLPLPALPAALTSRLAPLALTAIDGASGAVEEGAGMSTPASDGTTASGTSSLRRATDPQGLAPGNRGTPSNDEATHRVPGPGDGASQPLDGGLVPRRAAGRAGATTPVAGTTGSGDLPTRLPEEAFVAALLVLAWFAGCVVGLVFLIVGVGRSALQARRARPVDDDEWIEDLEWHRNFFGIRRRVRLLQSARVRTPMTGGALRPAVLVPDSYASWSAERRRLVLLHELVHIRRYDVVRHLLTRLGVVLYWFNPLVWLAARDSAIAREQACDEDVLRLGVKPSVYASHLLELAQKLDSGRLPAAALPMIQRSQLEKRLMTILDSDARKRAPWSSALAATLMVITAVSAGMAAPAAQAPAEPAVEPSIEPFVQPSTAPAAQAVACWPVGQERIRGRFSGTITTDDVGVGRRINAVGVSNGDRIVQRWVDDLRLCLRASGNVELRDDGSMGAVGSAGTLILEAELDGRVQNLTIHNDGDGERLTWTVEGAAGPVTGAVEQWRDQMVTVLNQHARIMTLRGQRSSLRGEISSIRGQRSSLRGQISSIRGQRSSLRGQISSIRGRQSSLRGQISSARGHVSSLRGQISSARGHVSSLRGQISSHRAAARGLEASRYGATEEELAVIDAAVRRHQEAIRDLERQIEDYDVEARVAEIERQIENYDLDSRIAEIESRMSDEEIQEQIAEIEEQIRALDVERRVAEIEGQIEALDVDGKTEEIEREIEALNVDERVRQIEERLEPALRELRRTIQSIG